MILTEHRCGNLARKALELSSVRRKCGMNFKVVKQKVLFNVTAIKENNDLKPMQTDMDNVS